MLGKDIIKHFEESPELRNNFLGVYFLNTFPRSIKQNHICVVNLLNSTEGHKIGHWFLVGCLFEVSKHIPQQIT